MGQAEALPLLHNPKRNGTSFEVDFSTTPASAPWVWQRWRIAKDKQFVASSGIMGGFKAGKVRWIVLYAGVTN